MQKHIYFIALLGLLLGHTAVWGQQDDKMHTDRPGETLTPNLVNKGYWQAEAGVYKYGNNKDGVTWHHPQLLFKRGLAKWLDVRLMVSEDAKKESEQKHYSDGFAPLELGFKATLVKQQGWCPLITLYSEVGIPPTASKVFKTPHMPADIRLLFGQKINDKLQVNYNGGVLWTGDDTNPGWQFSLEPEMEVAKNCEVMAEFYGKAYNGSLPESYMDIGFSYSFSSNTQADIYGGKGLSESSHNYFISAGLSFRFKHR